MESLSVTHASQALKEARRRRVRWQAQSQGIAAVLLSDVHYGRGQVMANLPPVERVTLTLATTQISERQLEGEREHFSSGC